MMGRVAFIVSEYGATLTLWSQTRKTIEPTRRKNMESFVQELIKFYADLDHWFVHVLEDQR